MTHGSAVPIYRRLFPLVTFAIGIIVLMTSAVLSITDVMSLRGSLGAENELLAKLKQRVAGNNGAIALDPRDYVLEAPSQGVATADLQRRVSEILKSAGADLQLSEIIPTMADGEVGRLAIAVNFEIGEAQLVDLLHAIENAKPALLVERLSLRILVAGPGSTARRMQGTATIIGAWRVSP